MLKKVDKEKLLKNKKIIITMDIETVKGNKQVPILLTVKFLNKKGELDYFYTLVNKNLLHDPKAAVLDLFKRFYLNLKSILDTSPLKSLKNHTIYCHNLGGFDGYYIYKALFHFCDFNNITSILDKTINSYKLKVNLWVYL